MIVLAEGHIAGRGRRTSVADDGVEIDSSLSATSAFQQATPTMRSIATALRLFALVAGLAGLIAIGQAATRLQDAAGGDDPTLGALGATRTERWARLAAPSLLAVRGRHRARTGPRRGRVPALPDRAGSPRRPRSRVPRRRRHGGARRRGRRSPCWARSIAGVALWRVRRSTRVPQLGRVSRWGKVAAELGTPAPAVTGLTLASGTPGPSRPHRRRRHRAQRDGCARGLRLQRQRRPPARRTRPLRVGLRRGDRERVLGRRDDPAAARQASRPTPTCSTLSTLYTPASPSPSTAHPPSRPAVTEPRRVARSGDGPRRRTTGR